MVLKPFKTFRSSVTQKQRMLQKCVPNFNLNMLLCSRSIHNFTLEWKWTEWNGIEYSLHMGENFSHLHGNHSSHSYFSIWNNKQNSRKVCFAMLSLFWCKFREIVWAQHTSPYLAPSESGLKLIRAWWILRAPSPYSSGRNLLDFLFAKAKIPVQNVVNVALQFDLFCAEGGKLFPLFNRLKLGR